MASEDATQAGWGICPGQEVLPLRLCLLEEMPRAQVCGLQGTRALPGNAHPRRGPWSSSVLCGPREELTPAPSETP